MSEQRPITHETVQPLFTRATGDYLFARWGRPIVPVVFGVEAGTLATVKGAVEAVVALAGHKMAETDPELGANLMIFFFRDWQELLEVPNLDQLIDGLQDLVVRLGDQGASQYRVFRFDPDGAIRACFSFVRMDAGLDEVPAEVIALQQAVLMIVLWSDTAFNEHSPLAMLRGVTVLRPEIAAVIAAGYDPVMPAVARDSSHALRLAARADLRQDEAMKAVRDLRREVGEADQGAQMAHEFPLRVYYEDTDFAGIVYYANYLKFIERGRSEFIRSLGVDQVALKADHGLVFAVRRVEADYLRPGKFDDQLVVVTEMVAETGARLVMDQAVTRDGEVLFTASVTIVCMNESGTPQRLPADMRRKLAPKLH